MTTITTARRSEVASPDIALFVPTLEGGGAEKVMLILAREFANRGYTVDLVLASLRNSYTEAMGSLANVVDLGGTNVRSAFLPLVKYLRRARPDVFMSTLADANIAAFVGAGLSRYTGRVALRETTCPSAYARLHRSPRQSITGSLLKWAYQRADTLIAPAESVAQDMAVHYRIPMDRITVIGNPTVTPDMAIRAQEPVAHPWMNGRKEPVVLAAGSLLPYKNYDLLIKAFHLVRMRRSSKLVILGGGPDRRSLEALAERLGIKDAVSLPGFVDNPFAYMTRAAAFVHTSRFEGLPNVLIEAMACGCQIVATDSPGGVREILADGKYGRLAPPGDAQKLCEAITGAIEDPIPRTFLRMGAERFHSGSISEEYLRVLMG